MKVAVIDSGVHVAHPHIGRIAGGASFGPSSPDYSDRLGHGTAVMAAIQEKAPGAEYWTSFDLECSGGMRLSESTIVQRPSTSDKVG